MLSLFNPTGRCATISPQPISSTTSLRPGNSLKYSMCEHCNRDFLIAALSFSLLYAYRMSRQM